MESVPSSPFDRKRRREGEDWLCENRPVDKKAKPTTVQFPNSEERLWFPRDSVIGASSQQIFAQHAKYDSDDQSSMVSEPGSPQPLSQVSEEDVSMLSDDDDQRLPSASDHSQNHREDKWRAQLQRVPTPVHSPKLGSKLLPNHMRSRHPQEIMSSDRLEVPSPVDEDEVPTPPSAAEAAGSQLELLSVDDVEMESVDDIPSIALQSERSLQLDGSPDLRHGLSRMDSIENSMLRKTRARSDALSASGSPMRDSPGPVDTASGKRGFSMGYRADCDKCRHRVPGHMNHFY